MHKPLFYRPASQASLKSLLWCPSLLANSCITLKIWYIISYTIKCDMFQNIIDPTTGYIRIPCHATPGSVWMTTNVSIVLIWVAESWPDQTRLLRLIHTKFIILLFWYRARCSVARNSDIPCRDWHDLS